MLSGIEGRRSRAGPRGHSAEARRRPLPAIGFDVSAFSKARRRQRCRGGATTDEPCHSNCAAPAVGGVALGAGSRGLGRLGIPTAADRRLPGHLGPDGANHHRCTPAGRRRRSSARSRSPSRMPCSAFPASRRSARGPSSAFPWCRWSSRRAPRHTGPGSGSRSNSATSILPDGVQPQLGPLATAYGEIYRYELVSDGTHDLIELRTLNDWVVTRRLMRVPGVAEVANFGGFQKQFAVTFNQAQLNRYGLRWGTWRMRSRRTMPRAAGASFRAAACRWSCAAKARSRTSTKSRTSSSSPLAERPSISRT